MTELEIYRADDGQEFKLGCVEPSDDELGLLQTTNAPDVPESEWVVVGHEECKRRVEAFLSLHNLNQKNHGSCVGFSGAGALAWDLWSSGLPPIGKLSGAYVYSWINGNRDRGASIPAALNALTEHGTCLESTVPWNVIYRRQMPAGADEEAKRFMLHTGGRVKGFAPMVSALQVGKPVQFGVQAGGSFGRFDDEGICGYRGRGSNHSVFAAPLLVRKKNGGFKIPMINSWGLWGPWKTGWAYVDERHFEGGGGGFIHGTPKLDPQNPNFPPAV